MNTSFSPKSGLKAAILWSAATEALYYWAILWSFSFSELSYFGQQFFFIKTLY